MNKNTLKVMLGEKYLNQLLDLCAEYTVHYKNTPELMEELLDEFTDKFKAIIANSQAEFLTPEEILEVKQSGEYRNYIEIIQLVRDTYADEISERINVRLNN